MKDVISAVKLMTDTIEELKGKKDVIDKQITRLNDSILSLYQIKDICPNCNGEKTIYDYSQIEGDPYGRSSDARVKCHECNGTGKFVI